MLTIRGSDESSCQEWHVGEPFPTPKGRIVKIVADGHELQYLMGVLKAHESRAYAFAVRGEKLCK